MFIIRHFFVKHLVYFKYFHEARGQETKGSVIGSHICILFGSYSHSKMLYRMIMLSTVIYNFLP